MAITATFYRLLIGVGLLGGLAACGRATYSFSNEAERRPLLAAALSVVSDTAAARAPCQAAPAGLAATRLGAARRQAAALLHRRRARLRPPAQPAEPRAESARPRLAGRRAAGRSRPAATSGALVTAGTLDELFAAVVLYTLLFALLVGAGLYLLGKLVRWGLLKWAARRRAKAAASRPGSYAPVASEPTGGGVSSLPC